VKQIVQNAHPHVVVAKMLAAGVLSFEGAFAVMFTKPDQFQSLRSKSIETDLNS